MANGMLSGLSMMLLLTGRSAIKNRWFRPRSPPPSSIVASPDSTGVCDDGRERVGGRFLGPGLAREGGWWAEDGGAKRATVGPSGEGGNGRPPDNLGTG